MMIKKIFFGFLFFLALALNLYAMENIENLEMEYQPSNTIHWDVFPLPKKTWPYVAGRCCGWWAEFCYKGDDKICMATTCILSPPIMFCGTACLTHQCCVAGIVSAVTASCCSLGALASCISYYYLESIGALRNVHQVTPSDFLQGVHFVLKKEKNKRFGRHVNSFMNKLHLQDPVTQKNALITKGFAENESDRALSNTIAQKDLVSIFHRKIDIYEYDKWTNPLDYEK